MLCQLLGTARVAGGRAGQRLLQGRYVLGMEGSRPSSDMAKFREYFAKAKHVVVLTGAGVSAESGVPTFRGAGGFWRTWQAQDLASPHAFRANPSLVWEFYHYRREVMNTKEPNPNIDELHRRAGSTEILELHGSLFRTRCTNCLEILANRDSPICPALAGKGAPDPKAEDARISEADLPRCKACSGLLRPDVVWFGEGLDPAVLAKTDRELDSCDLCLVVGTSSVVYPAAMFAPSVASRGVPVAEFNLESTPATDAFGESLASGFLPAAELANLPFPMRGKAQEKA
ncbi:sirtuin-5 [Penaeus vannamei]|uniref:NAD-dependent protein deacylase n=1 Tax=Penaeus vannamei TaxID=6689 RepID=A0A423TZC2_PENVA|nr:sirtuin-5 [Penaeus vannamei]